VRKNDGIYRTLPESAAGGIVVDAEGGIVMASGKAGELSGYRQEDLPGGVVDMPRAPGAVPGQPPQPDPGDRALLRRPMQERERVTELTQALRASEARFHSVVTGNADGIIIVDESGVIRFANPASATLFGHPEKELLGKYFGFPAVSGKTTELRIARHGKAIVVEMRAADAEWDERPARLLTMRDITDRKRDEEQIKTLNAELAVRAEELESANRELEAFNYTVAHDLRQPLNNIALFCQAMEMICGAGLDDTCKGYITDIHNVTLRMNRLIDDLLRFSRMGQVEPRRAALDLGALAHEIVTALKRTDPGRRIDVRIAESIQADADPGLMQVVLSNLLDNAWKYTGALEQAVIEFGVTNDGETPVYFIRDNGAGFNRDDAGRLFTPFQRLHGHGQFKGFGIGLATVQRIIRRHGGRIWAEGEPDRGATFYFTL